MYSTFENIDELKMFIFFKQILNLKNRKHVFKAVNTSLLATLKF